MNELTELTDLELLEMAQGCGELSCIYHGEVNRERVRRNTERRRRRMEEAAV